MKKVLYSQNSSLHQQFHVRFVWKIFFILFSILFCSSLLPAATETKSEDESKEKSALYLLSNDDLLKQADDIFLTASDAFLAQMRGLVQCEKLLKDTQQKTEALFIPKETLSTVSADASSEDAAKKLSEHTKARVDALELRLELIQTQKTLLGNYIRQLNVVQLTAKSFKDAMDRLNLFLLETQLRVADNTLSPDKIPAFLNEQNLKEKQQTLFFQQNELGEKGKYTQKLLEHTVSEIEEIKKTIIEAKARYASAQGKYAQELTRQTLEKEYSNESPQTLTARISELQEERMWLKGAFNVSFTRLKHSQTESLAIQKEIESLSPPETPEILLQKGTVRTEEMEQATKQVDEIVAYHSERIEKLEKLRAALESLIKDGEIFQGDATVLTEHLFRMQVLAKIIEDAISKGNIASDTVLADARSDMLADAGNNVSELTSDVVSAIQEAAEQLTQLDTEIAKSETFRKETQERLASLQKGYESALEAQKWEAELKNLTAQDVVLKFQENAKKLQTNQESLKSLKAEYKKANNVFEETEQKFETLRDPLMRVAQEESLEEKYNILKTLYEISGLEIPAEKAKLLSQAQTPSPEPVKKETDKDAGDKPYEKEKPETAVADAQEKSEIRAYQNLISTRVRIIEEREKLRAELLNVLKTLDQKLEQYVTALQETNTLALQHHANAIELKKRVGSNQLDPGEIPEGVTDALKRDLINELEDETTGRTNYQLHIRQMIESLGVQDETVKKTQALLTEIQTFAGKRLDIFHELQKLGQNMEQKQEELSATDLKSLEQRAIRRMNAEDTGIEFLVGFVPSEGAKSLTDLLKAYYQELMELENNQGNLKIQKDKTEHLIQLAQQEKASDAELLPLLQQQEEQAKIERDEEWVKISARLMPEKAEEILGNFETKTGRRLPTPALLLDEYKIPVIEKTADLLFEKHIQMVSAGKWIRLFEQRILPSGIEAEIGEYQDNIGALNSKYSALDRRIWSLKGHPLSELKKLAADEVPKTETDKRRFLEGEIGIIRTDRYKIRSHAALTVVIKLIIIFLIAVVVNWIVIYLINRAIITRTQKSEKGKSIATVAILPLCKTISVFIIWMGAFISVLSVLGFNVGAILAGLGIGGFAVAMASKETLGDIIGGINILLSKSFKVGDNILFGGQKAEVENIGLQYTKLRNSSGFLITVPNSQFAQKEAVNLSEAPGYYVNIVIALSIRNTMEKIRLAVQLTTDIISKKPDVRFKNVKLVNFDNYAFRMSVRYIIQDFSVRHTMRTEIHSEIVKQFQENHIEFAAQPYIKMNGE